MYLKYGGVILVIFGVTFLLYGLPRPLLVAAILLPVSVGKILRDLAWDFLENRIEL